MQPSGASAPQPPPQSRMPLILILGALVMLILGGTVGYLIGSAGLGHATLAISVVNNFGSTLSVQITVNGQLVSSATLASGQTTTVNVPAAFATANGAVFDVEAAAAAGPRDSQSVFVNAPGTYPVNLRLA